LDVLAIAPSEGTGLIAILDGLHTREGVKADLDALFESHPHAVAILHDCRIVWGPFVQAGVVSFLEDADEHYHFKLFGDLGPGTATSNLGIVYPDVDAVEVRRTLREFGNLFSERLDPFRLLQREAELVRVVTLYKDRAESLGREHNDLTRRNRALEEHHSKRKERKLPAGGAQSPPAHPLLQPTL
jgi:hypothetical protein